MTWIFFSLKDVADKLGTKPYRIAYFISTGVLPDTIRIGGRRAWNTSQIEEMRRILKSHESRRKKY